MKKIMSKAVLTGIISLSFASVAMAGAVPNLNQGTKQLSINGTYDANHPLDYQLTLDGGFGYFFVDNLMLGVAAGWQSNNLSDKYELGMVGEYNINFGSPWVPYLGVGVLYVGAEVDDDLYNNSEDMDADAWLGRFSGGVKYFFRDDIALALSVNYDMASEDIYADDEGKMESYNWNAMMGLRFYFD